MVLFSPSLRLLNSTTHSLRSNLFFPRPQQSFFPLFLLEGCRCHRTSAHLLCQRRPGNLVCVPTFNHEALTYEARFVSDRARTSLCLRPPCIPHFGPTVPIISPGTPRRETVFYDVVIRQNYSCHSKPIVFLLIIEASSSSERGCVVCIKALPGQSRRALSGLRFLRLVHVVTRCLSARFLLVTSMFMVV